MTYCPDGDETPSENDRLRVETTQGLQIWAIKAARTVS